MLTSPCHSFSGESHGQKSFLNQPKNQSMKDSIQAGNSNDWDSTALFYALLYSSHQLLSNARKPPLRIPPLLSSEWVHVLRERRNYMAHCKQTSLSETDFNALVNDVKQAFTGLGFPLTNVNQLETGVLYTLDFQRLQNLLNSERKRYAVIYDS